MPRDALTYTLALCGLSIPATVLCVLLVLM